MSIAQAHLEIARERFLELMAENPEADAYSAARTAIKQADDFAEAYAQSGGKLGELTPVPTKKTKGCKVCFGSGGKPIDPCKACGGTGKVPA